MSKLRGKRVEMFKRRELLRKKIEEHLRYLEEELERRWSKLTPPEKQEIDNWNSEED